MKSSGAPDKLWSEDFTVKASLDTPQPKIEGDTYTWEGKVSANLGSFTVQNGQVTDIPEKSRHQEGPVSYTHLDVYKRQGVCRDDEKNITAYDDVI